MKLHRDFALYSFGLIIFTSWTSVQAALNDTGIKSCSDASKNNLACPVTNFPRQDAEYGRDVVANDNSDGHTGFSFTKLDAEGQALSADAQTWSCVRDNVTGLIWEVKTTDGGLRDKNWTYSWYDSSAPGGDPGTPSGGTCYTAQHCDTEKYVQDVNSNGLCGFQDWRLPNVQELFGLVDQSVFTFYPMPKDPMIENNYFINTLIDKWFWSGSPDVSQSSSAWYVNFSSGVAYQNLRKKIGYVRLARGATDSNVFVDQGNGTIIQTNTGLQWAKCPEGLSGKQCTTGTLKTLTWQQALSAANSSKLAGYKDWRLPNIKELQSIVDYGRAEPAIDQTYFPNTPSNDNQYFWSGSPDVNSSQAKAWYLSSGLGLTFSNLRSYSSFVRLVRGDPVWFPLNIILSGQGTVTSTDGSITCPQSCGANYLNQTEITLTATPSAGWKFANWGGGCTGTNPTCVFTIQSATQVTANFQKTNSYQLDSPVNGSFESGIGVVSGWVCQAKQIGIQVDQTNPFIAAYGAKRPDSKTICGDTANGFAAAINWADYGSGQHTLKILADDQVLTQATVQVTTFGVSFLRGFSKTFTVNDFPKDGFTTILNWSEPNQNFMVGSVPPAAEIGRTTGAGNWESPLDQGYESGYSLIRGWSCEAKVITATLDNKTKLSIPYGSSRDDTQGICGDSNNGYALAINWNTYKDGEHKINLILDGISQGNRVFTLTTPGGQGQVTGVQRQEQVADFPFPGDLTTLQWSEPHQNFRFSAYQAGTTFKLKIIKTGEGQGKVTGSGIICGKICEKDLPRNSNIVLTAKPDVGMSLSSWDGCIPDSINPLKCKLILDQPKNITVNFTKQ